MSIRSSTAAEPSPQESTERAFTVCARVLRTVIRFAPPFGDRRFWAVQTLVAFVAIGHTSLEIMRESGHAVLIGNSPQVALLSFLPVSLFFVPVVYAAVSFGFTAAVATAAWCTMLTVPNIVMHDGVEKLREALQLGIVDVVAVFVGQRVEREVAARRRVEEARAALRASEMKYRGLFESSAVAVLVIDSIGTVIEANMAAAKMFLRPLEELLSSPIRSILGETGEQLMDAIAQGRRDLPKRTQFKRSDGSVVYLQPLITAIPGISQNPAVQILLRDVTAEEFREAGLRAYAAGILRAQEEERRRIAQELHDESVQSLILLCRRLDSVEANLATFNKTESEEIARARADAEATVQTLRDFARALRPPALDELGLIAAIRRLTVEITERSRISVVLNVQGKEQRLHPDLELGLFRIAQEALRNAERHSRAKTITATLRFSDAETNLSVADDGVGFTIPAESGEFVAGQHLGILGMRERAEILGGNFRVLSEPGLGTKVQVFMRS